MSASPLRRAGDRPGRKTIIPFVVAAACGPAMVLLPGPPTKWDLFSIACVLMIVVIGVGLVAVGRVHGRRVVLPMALLYLVAVGLLRHSVVGATSGYLPLAMLPVVWLALFGDRRTLVLGLAAMGVTLLAPQLIFGAPQYPPASLRSGLLLIVVAGLAGLTIQLLLSDVRSARDQVSQVLAAATDTAIIALDRHGKVTVFNRGAELILGYSAREMVGRATPLEWLDPDEVAERRQEVGATDDLEAFFAVAREHGVERRRLAYLRKDGTRLDAAQALTAERRGGGPGYLIVASDVTARVAAQAALKEERDFTHAVIETVGSLVVVLDREGRIERFNRTSERMTGRRAEDIIGQRPWEVGLIPPEAVEEVRDGVEAAYPEAFPHDYESEWLTASGERRLVAWSATCLVDDAGELTHIVNTGTDVTDQRRAERELRRSTDRLQGILEHATATITVAARDGRFVLANPAWVEYVGRDPVGLTAEELLPPAVAEQIRRTDAKVLRTGKALEYERVDADRTWLVVKFPLRDDAGEVSAVGTIGTDITERERALAEALAASRAKSEFLANMSHEIRTPLNGVIGMLELLADTELTAEQRSFVTTSTSSGDALLSVINDVLDFSKIEAGKLELDPHPVDVRRLVEDACDMVALAAHTKGVELVDWIDEAVPATLLADGGRLRQVLINLLSNAVKFTSRGEVSVQVTAQPHGPETVLLGIEVRDTGLGIEPAALERLFEPFTQADSSTTRNFGGTGLGLAIARRLVDAMGGTLRASSAPGEGSTFAFEVALEPAGPAEALPAPPDPPADLRVLVVDDNATNRAIVAGYLAGRVATCDEADGAGTALELLHGAATAERPYDVALLDLQMPDLDGAELARRIRATPELAATRLVLLTSAGEPVGGAGALPLDGYLAKPVRRGQLLEVIAAALAGGGPRTAAPAGEQPNAIAAAARVLVAEDNAVNQFVIGTMLRKRGLTVDVVEDGLQAVEAFDPDVHDIVFMDCQMPLLDGYQATGRIRESGSRVPIVAMTAHALEGDRERCLRAGMDDYLAKPLRPELLDTTLRRWLPQDDGDALLDEARVRSLDDSYPGMIASLAAVFRSSTPELLEGLRESVEQGDEDRRGRLAHKLKGSTATVGAARMAALAEALERPGPADPATVERLEEAYTETLAALERRVSAPARP